MSRSLGFRSPPPRTILASFRAPMLCAALRRPCSRRSLVAPTVRSMATGGPSLTLVPRRSSDRGHADHGWLRSYHTFSFADYYDEDFEKYGVLRVINEDRVVPTKGFGQHRHANFNIWSYIVSGELEHRDSQGNLEILQRGEIQMTTVGSGVEHSEFNRNDQEEVHFCQIWAEPARQGLRPQYYTRKFSDVEKRGRLVKTVAPLDDPDTQNARVAEGPAPVQSPLTMYASILPGTTSIQHRLANSSSKAYIHLIMTSGYRMPGDEPIPRGARLRVGEGSEVVELEEGDGLFVGRSGNMAGKVRIESVGEREAEFLLFEM